MQVNILQQLKIKVHRQNKTMLTSELIELLNNALQKLTIFLEK